MPSFYDQLAPLYHLIHQDWSDSLRRQGEELTALMNREWPGRRRVLDLSCGIGTQAIALALQGWQVQASDLSSVAIGRASEEARMRGLSIAFSVCDMQQAHAHHGDGFEMVISCDNSLPHLLNDEAILRALQQMHACLAPGGGCLITLRDYAREERGRNLVKPQGARLHGDKRTLLFQVWDFDGELYDLAFFFVEENVVTQEVRTQVMRSRYYAISVDRLAALMEQVGFERVRRIDGAFYQPVLVGSKPS